MTKTATPAALGRNAPIEATEQVILDLRYGGLASSPLRMIESSLQPIVAVIRSVNIGESDASALQPLLDVTYGPGAISAADVCLSSVPTGDFTVEVDEEARLIRLISADKDIGITDDNVRWASSSGYTLQGRTVEFRPREVLTWIRCEVAVAGGFWNVTKDETYEPPPEPLVPAVSASAVGFDVTATVTGDPDTSYGLSWGDGSSADATVVTDASGVGTAANTYAAEGTYTITVTGAEPELTSSTDVTVSAEVPPLADPESFDPGDFNVGDVLDFAEAHPHLVAALRKAEQKGKNRQGVLDGLDRLDRA